MNRNKIIILLLFIFTNGFSQNLKIIYGQLTSKEQIPTGVKIVNLKTEREVTSDASGKFVIIAELGDLLVFSSENYEYERKIIEEKEFNSASVTVNLTAKAEVLDEVVIKNYNNINAVSLGILSKPAKQYTPAERKLYTASHGTDGFINSLTGRKKMLKRAAIFEQNEIVMAKLDKWFETDFYINRLKIKEEEIPRFKYFAVENKKNGQKLRSNDKFQVTNALAELSVEFNKIQNKKK